MKKRQTQHWLSLALSVLMTSGPFLSAWAEPDYYILKSHGRPISRISIDHYLSNADAANPNQGIVTEIRNSNRNARNGEPFALNEVSRFLENSASGQPLSFQYAYDLGEQHLVEAHGQVQGDALTLLLKQEEHVSQGKAPVTAERFFFPAGPGIHQVFQRHYNDPKGSRFSFQTMTMGMQPQIVNNEVRLAEKARLKLNHGKHQAVRKFAITNPANDKAGVYEWRDARGKLYKAQSTGPDEMEMVLAAVDDDRLDQLDVIKSSTVVSGKIAQPRITTEALYRLSPTQGQSINWRNVIPTGDRQNIQKLTDNQLYLKVYQQPPKDTSVPYPITGPEEYLKSTPYVQSSDPEIDRLALDTVGSEKRAYYAGLKLQRWVYDNIVQKDLSLGFASAKETMLRRQGDCTEHAVLLAALTRALGIPSRVAVGLIYLPNGDSQLGRFVYHMWTEIYLTDGETGEWVPLDATNPEPMVDATHIKLADSALNNTSDLITLTQQATNLMGRLRIDVLKAMSLSQSVLTLEAKAGITATALRPLDIEQIDIQTLSKRAIQRYRVEMPPASMSKESPDGLFTYGLEALSKNQYSQAQAYFQQAMDKLREPIALYRMGERLAGIEMYTLAQEAFQRAANKDDRLGPLVQAWNAGYLPPQNLPDDLNQQFMQANNVSGEAANVILLQTLTTQAPDFAPAFRRLGEERTGQDAIIALKQAVALAPDDFRNYESLGDKLMQQKQYAAAMEAYRNAAQALKKYPAFLQSKPGWLSDIQGKQMIAHGSSLLHHQKQTASGWLVLAQGLLQQKQRNEAAQALETSLSLNPQNPDAQILRFRMALQNADWRTIYAQKDAITSLSGNSAQAAALTGLYQMRSRQYTPAVQSLQHAIALQPNQTEAYRTLAQTYLRMAELAQGQPGKTAMAKSKNFTSKAKETLQRGIAHSHIANERHSISLQLAELLLKSGQAEEAQQLATGVLNDNPIQGEAWRAAGKAQFFLGDSAAARNSLTTALTLNPNDPDTLILLGHVAKEEGKDGLAMDYYQKAYKADSYNAEAAESVRNLMTQLKVSGRKPPKYWFFTDDEHDYIVQLLFQGKILKQHTLSYLKVLNSLPGRAGKIEYSAKGIASAKQLQTTLELMSKNESILARNLDQTVVPARFADLHLKFQDAVLAEMKALSDGIQYGPILDHSARETSKQNYVQLLLGINKTQTVMHDFLKLLYLNLPDPVFAGLLSEAQLENIQAIDREIAATSNVLLNKQDPEKGNAKSADATPLPAAKPKMKPAGAMAKPTMTSPKTPAVSSAPAKRPPIPYPPKQQAGQTP